MSQSSPVKTGYQKTVTEKFKETAYITNLHSDTVDITNEIQVRKMLDELNVYALINNAGIANTKLLHEETY